MKAGELPFTAIISFILFIGTSSAIPQLSITDFAKANSSSVTPSALDIALAPRPSIIGVFGITSTTFALSIV